MGNNKTIMTDRMKEAVTDVIKMFVGDLEHYLVDSDADSIYINLGDARIVEAALKDYLGILEAEKYGDPLEG